MTRVTIAALLALVALAAPASGQQTLSNARDLYATAAYDEALAILDLLKSAEPSVQDRREIEQYRALCLLALKRQSEAERAIEALVAVDPFYRPGEGDAAPWVRASFASVRRRLLAVTAQRHYVEAKALFDKKEYGKAAAQFNRVLAMLEDPDVGPVEDNTTLADLRTLAQGFLELCQNALTKEAATERPSEGAAPQAPAAPPPAPTVQPAAQGVPPPSADTSTTASPLRIYSVADADVVPPTTLFQRLPPWPAGFPRFVVAPRGVLEIVIDESGLVESVVMVESLHPKYDSVLIEAARTWRYMAATRDGRAVKYRRRVEVLGPGQPSGTGSGRRPRSSVPLRAPI